MAIGTQIQSAAGRLRGHAAFWLKAFAQPTIDLTLRTHEGLITRIVEGPGRALGEEELARLVAQLRVVAGKTLPAGDLTYGIFSGERERLSRAIVTVIVEEASGRPIALCARWLRKIEPFGQIVTWNRSANGTVGPTINFSHCLSSCIVSVLTNDLFACRARTDVAFIAHPFIECEFFFSRARKRIRGVGRCGHSLKGFMLLRRHSTGRALDGFEKCCGSLPGNSHDRFRETRHLTPVIRRWRERSRLKMAGRHSAGQETVEHLRLART